MLGNADFQQTITTFGEEEFFELAYRDGARFLVDGRGIRVRASRPARLAIDYLATYLRGPVMGFVLRRRGILALHGSAVCIGEESIVFCGPSEAGKSTIAAALSSRGVPVLSDDIAALGLIDDIFHVAPGYPWLCLWPDTDRFVLDPSKPLPQITAGWEKRYLSLKGTGFKAESRPVGAIYLLAPRSSDTRAPRIEALGSHEAVWELAKNTYMNWLLDRTARAVEFDSLSRLVAQIPVKRIVPHTDPSKMGELCELISWDLDRFTPAKEFASSVS